MTHSNRMPRTGHGMTACGMQELFDSPETLKKKVKQLADILRTSKYTVVYTGAGISTSAGIPDYRGPSGVWTLKAHGKEVVEPDFGQLQPTSSHYAIKLLMSKKLARHIVSQNIDGLHRRSGISSNQISELHGNYCLESCPSCGAEYFRPFAVWGGLTSAPGSTALSAATASKAVMKLRRESLGTDTRSKNGNESLVGSGRQRGRKRRSSTESGTLEVAPLPAKLDKKSRGENEGDIAPNVADTTKTDYPQPPAEVMRLDSEPRDEFSKQSMMGICMADSGYYGAINLPTKADLSSKQGVRADAQGSSGFRDDMQGNEQPVRCFVRRREQHNVSTESAKSGNKMVNWRGRTRSGLAQLSKNPENDEDLLLDMGTNSEQVCQENTDCISMKNQVNKVEQENTNLNDRFTQRSERSKGKPSQLQGSGSITGAIYAQECGERSKYIEQQTMEEERCNELVGEVLLGTTLDATGKDLDKGAEGKLLTGQACKHDEMVKEEDCGQIVTEQSSVALGRARRTRAWSSQPSGPVGKVEDEALEILKSRAGNTANAMNIEHEGIRDGASVAGHDHRTGRKCVRKGCNGDLVDSVVLFGESMPLKALQGAEEHSAKAEVALVLGSSLRVGPACDFPGNVPDHGGKLVIVNLQRTPMDRKASLVIHGRCDEVMELLLAELNLSSKKPQKSTGPDAKAIPDEELNASATAVPRGNSTVFMARADPKRDKKRSGSESRNSLRTGSSAKGPLKVKLKIGSSLRKELEGRSLGTLPAVESEHFLNISSEGGRRHSSRRRSMTFDEAVAFLERSHKDGFSLGKDILHDSMGHVSDDLGERGVAIAKTKQANGLHACEIEETPEGAAQSSIGHGDFDFGQGETPADITVSCPQREQQSMASSSFSKSPSQGGQEEGEPVGEQPNQWRSYKRRRQLLCSESPGRPLSSVTDRTNQTQLDDAVQQEGRHGGDDGFLGSGVLTIIPGFYEPADSRSSEPRMGSALSTRRIVCSGA